jgi:hypothetical protein
MYLELETVVEESAVAYAKALFCMISGFRREVDGNCALLRYHAGSGGDSLPTFRDNLSVPSSGMGDTLKIGPDSLSRNVDKNLPPLPA